MDFASSPAASEVALLGLSQALHARAYRFAAITPASHRSINARPENVCARTVRDVFGWSRPFTEGVLDPDLLAAAHEADVLVPADIDGVAAWRSLVRAATFGDLIFLHSAFPTDAADAVFFGPDSYRFTAAIDAHLSCHALGVRRAIDIGAGAGPGGIVIARACPNADIVLTDINPAALRVAQVNALAAGVTNVRCRESDVMHGIDGTFDLIVANPPYLVDAAARTYRHGGGPLGAALSLRILNESLPRLNQGGRLLLYTGIAIVEGGDRFRAAIEPILNSADLNWHYRELDPDVFGEELAFGAYRHADRIAAVVLTVQRIR